MGEGSRWEQRERESGPHSEVEGIRWEGDAGSKPHHPRRNKTGPPDSLESRTPELDEKTVAGAIFHRHRSRPNEEMAVGHRTSGRANVPMWRNPECSAFEKMPVGCGWGGEKHGAMLEGQGVVWRVG